MSSKQIRLLSSISCITIAAFIAVFWRNIDINHYNKQIVETSKNQQVITKKNTTNKVSTVPSTINESFKVNKGDTLSSILKNLNIDTSQSKSIIQTIQKTFNPRLLRPSHKINITFTYNKDGTRKYIKLFSIQPSIDNIITLQRNDDGKFIVKEQVIKLKKQMSYTEGVIKANFYKDATKQNVPSQILNNVANVFSYNINFKRNVQAGTAYGIMYSSFYGKNNQVIKPGKLIYAFVKMGNKVFKAYRFKHNNGQIRFYDGKGRSINGPIFLKPIKNARISSGFGRRTHPVTKKRNKFHKGIDYAAPRGTPVFAAAKGIIKIAKRNCYYGNYIRINHKSRTATVYAHLSKFAKGVRPGTVVKQGQVIGYVGCTGRATGNHLHYEFIYNNKHINPLRIEDKLPKSHQLVGKELKLFLLEKNKIEKQYNYIKNASQNNLFVKDDNKIEKAQQSV